jgi:hypothetical protein
VPGESRLAKKSFVRTPTRSVSTPVRRPVVVGAERPHATDSTVISGALRLSM